MRLLCLTLVCQLVLAGPMAGASDAVPRLRPMDDDARRLIARGLDRSATFRDLVHRLDRSDVIVYIRLRPDMPDRLGGSLRYLSHSATDRFLVVSLNRRYGADILVALLGHELQHATEVADAPEVDSPLALRALYRRIGVRMQPDAYDSRAAIAAGLVVRDELAHGHDEVRMARREADPDRAREQALLGGGSIETMDAQ